MGKRLGRPMKAPTPGERVPLGLRVTADMKRTLEAAAVESGRSISAEAELRLEQSFEREWMLKSMQALIRKELKR